MAYQSIWYITNLPPKIIDIIEEDLEQFKDNFQQSQLSGGAINTNKRNSKNTWIPESHWISGFLWFYVDKANRDNFRYDLTGIDGSNIQFTKYEQGEFYGWHNDQGVSSYYKPQGVPGISKDPKVLTDFLEINTECIRKLSFILQLSDPDSYEGGNVQLLDENGKSYFVPRQKGTIIAFDSRTSHRVLKVTKGIRKSIVGWAVGPRWK